MDRFLLRIRIDYPSPEDERRILLESPGRPERRPGRLEPVLSRGRRARAAGRGRARPPVEPSSPTTSSRSRARRGGRRTCRWACRRAASWPGETPPAPRRWPTAATTCCPTTSSRWRGRRSPTGWSRRRRSRRWRGPAPATSSGCWLDILDRAPRAGVTRDARDHGRGADRSGGRRRRRPVSPDARGLVVPGRRPLLVGAAAINAGLNLYFLRLGDDAVSCSLAGGVLSELGLAGLRGARACCRRRSTPARPYLMGIALANRKRRLPSFSVEVEDLVDGRPIDKRCYFLKLPAGRMQETAYRHTIARRGRHHLSGFRLSTKFPVRAHPEVARRRRRARAAASTRRWCRVARAAAARAARRHHGARAAQVAPSRSGEFAGLRDFRPGDDPRDIHWRSTARRGVPLVRENEDDEGSRRRSCSTTCSATAPASRRSSRRCRWRLRWRRAADPARLPGRARRARGARSPPDGGPAPSAAASSASWRSASRPTRDALPGRRPRGARIHIRAGLPPMVEPGSGRRVAPASGGRPRPPTRRRAGGCA